jgi:CubicO group peptidase (beta-lactamase class C family)
MPLHRKAFLLAAWLVALAAGSAAAQVPANAVARLDSLLSTLATHDRVMGSVAIRQGDRLLYTRTVGFRDSTASGWVPSDSATRYRVGSVTKPFTAVMVYQLVDEGKLTLGTPLSRFFPRIPAADSITIGNLLGHTSGIGDFIAGMDPLRALSRDSILARIAAAPRQFTPGTRRRYSNSNYMLLGYIIESLTGTSYAEQLERRVARRAGLRRTGMGGVIQPGRNEARAYFYDEGHWALQPDHAIENAGGSGGAVSTAADLTRFLHVLFSGRLISPAGLHEMRNGFDDGTRKSGKGMSPFSIPGSGKTGYSHDGSIGAFSALFGYVPEDSLSVALTINGHNYPPNRLFFHIWDILVGGHAPLPAFDPVALPDSLAAQLEGVYTAAAYGITIAVRRGGAGLQAQTEGQEPFALQYVGARRFINARDGILIEFAAPVEGRSPRCTLYQQLFQIPLERRAPAPAGAPGPGTR